MLIIIKCLQVSICKIVTTKITKTTQHVYRRVIVYIWWMTPNEPVMIVVRMQLTPRVTLFINQYISVMI